MEKVYRVFVSSTYSDLKDERKRVAETLIQAGFIPAGMELFPAADQEQLEFIQRVIDGCDYYVVIVGGRYGSLADNNISFTEKEYEYAVSKGVPVLAFIHSEPERIEVGKTDIDPTLASKLQAFRKKLATGRLVRPWTTVDDLCKEILISVVKESNRRPGVGWVRGDQTVDPKVLLELERLRSENAELKNQLLGLEAADVVRFSSNLLSPDALMPFDVKILKAIPSPSPLSEWAEVRTQTLVTTLGDVFVRMFSDTSIHELYDVQNELPQAIVSLSANELMQEEGVRFALLRPSVTKIGFHLEALGLITIDTGQSDAWEITAKGRRYIVLRYAITKPTSTYVQSGGE